MKRLIVSADDFGLSRSINEGIVKAYKEGIVTNLNVIPTGEAFDDAADLIKRLKLEEAGAHLALTETLPVSDPAKIPSLVTKNGMFYSNHILFSAKFMFGLIARHDVYLEFERQLLRVEKTGVRITNLSSHEHIHMIPAIMDMMVRLAKEHDIPAIRYPRKEKARRGFEIKKFFKYAVLSCFDKGMEKALRGSGIAYTENFAGFLDSGRLDERKLIDILSSLPEGTTELVCHPGFMGPEVMDKYRWHKNCERELYALTSPIAKTLIGENGIDLITYGKFASKAG